MFSVKSNAANPIMAALPFQRSALALKGPNERLSGLSFQPKIGTKEAQMKTGTTAKNHTNPVLSKVCCETLNPLAHSAAKAQTIPTIANLPLIVSGAGPSNFITLWKSVLPNSGRRSLSGRANFPAGELSKTRSGSTSSFFFTSASVIGIFVPACQDHHIISVSFSIDSKQHEFSQFSPHSLKMISTMVKTKILRQS